MRRAKPASTPCLDCRALMAKPRQLSSPFLHLLNRAISIPGVPKDSRMALDKPSDWFQNLLNPGHLKDLRGNLNRATVLEFDPRYTNPKTCPPAPLAEIKYAT